MPAATTSSAIVVFESRPCHGPELQRQFAHSEIVIRECRSVDDLFLSIDEYASSVLVIDPDSGLVEVIEWLGRFATKQSRRTPIIVVGGSTDLRELEWILREAGVTAFLPDHISGVDLARLCRCQLGLVCRSGT